MPSKHFFATNQDLGSLFASVETDCPLQYLADDHPSGKSVFKSAATAMEKLGLGVTDTARSPRFLVLRSADASGLAKGVLRMMLWGGRRDQLSYPQSVQLIVGGQHSPNVLIAGSWGTASDDDRSVALFKCVSRVMIARWRKVGAFLVGPKADELLCSGARLTCNVGADSSFDLIDD